MIQTGIHSPRVSRLNIACTVWIEPTIVGGGYVIEYPGG
jgi:hypothetical protein